MKNDTIYQLIEKSSGDVWFEGTLAQADDCFGLRMVNLTKNDLRSFAENNHSTVEIIGENNK